MAKREKPPKTKRDPNTEDTAKRQPPVRIPLPFGEAVEGLLQVKPLAKKRLRKTGGAGTK